MGECRVHAGGVRGHVPTLSSIHIIHAHTHTTKGCYYCSVPWIQARPTQPPSLTTHHPRILVPNTAMNAPRRSKHTSAHQTSGPRFASPSTLLRSISSHVIGTLCPARSVHAVPGPARGAKSRKEKNERRSPRHPRSLAPVLENQPHASFGVSIMCVGGKR